MILPDECQSVGQGCALILSTPDPYQKVKRARAIVRAWRKGQIALAFDVAMPDSPVRGDSPLLLPPGQMPRRKKLGSDRARIAMLHALAHIEYVAIDLAFDLIGRFGAQFPAAFVDQWMQVGAEEAMHFALLDRRLRQMGSHYGALPAHDGLWEAARDTANDALARLAIVPMVLEARALDITPATVERFESVGDIVTARVLQRILQDEIRHVAAGTQWFEWATKRSGVSPANHYQILVKRHFRGALKRPFNSSARRQAGLTEDFYISLAT